MYSFVFGFLYCTKLPRAAQGGSVRIPNLPRLLAEGGGFEPPVDLRPHNLSKVAPSTTRTPLQSLFIRPERMAFQPLLRGAKLVPEEGLEPSRTRVRQILSLLRLPLRHSGGCALERAKGIEPSWPAWKAGTLPLSYARFSRRTREVYQNSVYASMGHGQI